MVAAHACARVYMRRVCLCVCVYVWVCVCVCVRVCICRNQPRPCACVPGRRRKHRFPHDLGPRLEPARARRRAAPLTFDEALCLGADTAAAGRMAAAAAAHLAVPLAFLLRWNGGSCGAGARGAPGFNAGPLPTVRRLVLKSSGSHPPPGEQLGQRPVLPRGLSAGTTRAECRRRGRRRGPPARSARSLDACACPG